MIPDLVSSLLAERRVKVFILYSSQHLLKPYCGEDTGKLGDQSGLCEYHLCHSSNLQFTVSVYTHYHLCKRQKVTPIWKKVMESINLSDKLLFTHKCCVISVSNSVVNLKI